MQGIARCVRVSAFAAMLLGISIDYGLASDSDPTSNPTSSAVVARLQSVLLRMPLRPGVNITNLEGKTFAVPPQNQRGRKILDAYLKAYTRGLPASASARHVGMVFREFCAKSPDVALCRVVAPPNILPVDVRIFTTRSDSLYFSNGGSVRLPDFDADKIVVSGLEIVPLRNNEGDEIDCWRRTPGMCEIRMLIGRRVVASLSLWRKNGEINAAAAEEYKAAFIATLKNWKINQE